MSDNFYAFIMKSSKVLFENRSDYRRRKRTAVVGELTSRIFSIMEELMIVRTRISDTHLVHIYYSNSFLELAAVTLISLSTCVKL